MPRDKDSNYYSNSKMKITATETERKVEFTIPEEEAQDVTAGIFKNNHLRGLYSNYCILNQEFLDYVVSCKLTGSQSKLLFYLMAHMDKENRILLNNKILVKNLKITKKSVIEATKRLEELKIIIKQKLSAEKYEFIVKDNILNPQLAFKNKANRDNVMLHKNLIGQETPYIKQHNIEGDIDYVNQETGEVFYTKKKGE